MLSFSQISELVGSYTEVDMFCWDCYGDNVVIFGKFDSINRTDINVTYSAIKNEIMEISVSFENSNEQYRWINPEYLQAHINECMSRDIEFGLFIDDEYYTEVDFDSIVIKIKEITQTGE